MKRWITYLVYLLVILFITGESALRIKGIYKTYSERNGGKYTAEFGKRAPRYQTRKPGSNFQLKNKEFQYVYQINSLGYREHEIEPIGNSNSIDTAKIRVLVFGDSFVEGVGAPYDSTWPRLLEQQLVYEYGDAEVINCGVSGSDPFFNLIDFKERMISYQPSHVISSVNTSDIGDCINRGGMDRFTDKDWVQYRKAPWFHFFFRQSHLVRMYIIERLGYDFDLIKRSEREQLQQEALTKLESCLMATYQLCNENNINFMSVIHPFPNALCSRSTESWPLLDDLESSMIGIPRVVLSPLLEEEIGDINCQSIYWPIDQHYNSLGYELFSKAAYHGISIQNADFWTE